MVKNDISTRNVDSLHKFLSLRALKRHLPMEIVALFISHCTEAVAATTNRKQNIFPFFFFHFLNGKLVYRGTYGVISLSIQQQTLLKTIKKKE